jgi:hypothetical protein
MGSGKTYEVKVWRKVHGEYGLYLELATNWLIAAVLRLWFEKRKGYGCVVIEMR